MKKVKAPKAKPAPSISDEITKMDTKTLRLEISQMHSLINELECYGISDLRYYDALIDEADKRGIKISFRPCFLN